MTTHASALSQKPQPAPATPTRIVVLDGESPLQGLSLRGAKANDPRWVLTFAATIEAADQALAAEPADGLVVALGRQADERRDWLAEIKWRYPGVVRVVLVEGEQPQRTFELLSIAHQVLLRPTGASGLAEILARTCFLKGLMANQNLQAAVGDISALPAIPPIYVELTVALGHATVNMADIGRIVGRDPGLSAKILQIVNSALLGLSRRITSIEEAVVYVGTNVVRNLVLLSEVLAAAERRVPLGDLNLAALQRHSYLAATIAGRIIPDRTLVNEAFTATLLHDIGKMVFAIKFPGRSAAIRAQAREEEVPPHVLEQQQVGVTHAELGGYLMGLWGLPLPVVEAVAYHHEPTRGPTDQFGIVGAVHVADHLADEAAPNEAGRVDDYYACLDLSYLDRLHLLDQLPAWRATAAQLAGSTL